MGWVGGVEKMLLAMAPVSAFTTIQVLFQGMCGFPTDQSWWVESSGAMLLPVSHPELERVVWIP